MEILIVFVIFTMFMLTMTQSLGTIAHTQRETIMYLNAADHMNQAITTQSFSSQSKDFLVSTRDHTVSLDTLDHLLGFKVVYPELIVHEVTVSWQVAGNNHAISCAVISVNDPLVATV